MAAIDAKIRLYVGGLPSQITSRQLEARFASFGKVSAIQLIPSKQQPAEPKCRGFAYVEFFPKDDQSLQRCLSLYNGCKWLGGVLKVEKAKEHYLARLRREQKAEILYEEQQPQNDGLTIRDPPSAEPLRIPTPASGFVKRKLMTVKPGPVKRMFAPYKGHRLSELSWDPPPTPPGVRKRHAAATAAAAFSAQQSKTQQAQSAQQPNAPFAKLQSHDMHQSDEPHAQQQQQQQKKRKRKDDTVAEDPGDFDGIMPAGQEEAVHTSADAMAAPRQQNQHEEREQQQDETSEDSSDMGVVDFVSDDDIGDSAQGAEKDTDRLSWFDDSDDELMPAAADAHNAPSNAQHTQQQGQVQTAPLSAAAAAAAAAAGDLTAGSQPSTGRQQTTTATAALDLSRFDDDSSAQSESEDNADDDTQAPVDAAALPTSHSSESLPVDEADTQINQKGSGLRAQSLSEQSSGMSHSRGTSAVNDSDTADKSASDTTSEAAAEPDPESPSASEAAAKSDLASASEAASESELASASAAEAAAESDLASASEAASESDLASDVDIARDLAPQTKATQVQPQSAGETERVDTDSTSESDSHVSQVSLASIMPVDDAEQAAAETASDIEGDSEAEVNQQHASNDLATQPAADLAQTAATKASASKDHQDVEPTYPDLMMLQAGAAFWYQHKAMPEKSWQAQRQALHADYKAKHRAAAKHAQKGRKSRFG